MTASTTASAPTAGTQPRPVAVEPVTLGKVIRSEWIKLRSLRSSVVVLVLTVVFIVGLGLITSYFVHANWATMGPDEHSVAGRVRHTLFPGIMLGQLTIGALGVLVITGEYATGMIRATLGAVPRRLPVLWAKAAVFAPVSFILTLASAFAAFLGGQAILGSHGVSLGTSGSLRVVFGVALYLTVVGLLGMAIGFLVRSTAGAITTLFGLLLVLPAIGTALPNSWQQAILPYLPSTAGQALVSINHQTNTMHPWPGFALFCGYTAIAIIAAAYTLRHRDA